MRGIRLVSLSLLALGCVWSSITPAQSHQTVTEFDPQSTQKFLTLTAPKEYEGTSAASSFEYFAEATDWLPALQRCHEMLDGNSEAALNGGARPRGEGILKTIVIVGDGGGKRDHSDAIFQKFREDHGYVIFGVGIGAQADTSKFRGVVGDTHVCSSEVASGCPNQLMPNHYSSYVQTMTNFNSALHEIIANIKVAGQNQAAEMFINKCEPSNWLETHTCCAGQKQYFKHYSTSSTTADPSLGPKTVYTSVNISKGNSVGVYFSTDVNNRQPFASVNNGGGSAYNAGLWQGLSRINLKRRYGIYTLLNKIRCPPDDDSVG